MKKNSIPSIPKSVPSDKSDKSVNTLESLVPPLDLCKQIPEGAFEDSVLVWFGVKNHDSTMEVVPRLELGETCKVFLKKGIRVLFPAPTLQEIGMLPVLVDESDRYNPATAAIKLWFELNKEGDEK